MVKVGNQGLDDRYIPLRSHRIHILWCRDCVSHVFETRFSTRLPRLVSFSFHHSSTKFPFNRSSFEPELVSRLRPRTSNAPCLAKGNF